MLVFYSEVFFFFYHKFYLINIFKNEPIYHSIVTLLVKFFKKTSKSLAFDYDSKEKLFTIDPPNKQINETFDSILENIIK